MGERKIDTALVVALSCSLALIIVSALISRYVAFQANGYLARVVDQSLGFSGDHTSWDMLREGFILGRARSSQGDTAYVVVVRRPEGEYRVAMRVDEDGSVEGVRSMGYSSGFFLGDRLGGFFGVQEPGRGSGEASPLDAVLQPVVTKTMETITRLQRDSMEVGDGARQ
ncbi:MAG: hypothetical protein JXM71_09180 [Spirochaetales bacterium]|nr:hypothetical protein [Spirochaetales bacterium]